jgi:hypothetical protein
MTTTPAEPVPDPDDAEEDVDRIEEEDWAQHQPDAPGSDNGSAPQPEDDQGISR